MICVILPAYNEESSIDSLLNKIEQVMKENQYDYKIVFVNDGSQDKTAGVLSSYLDKMPIEVISHKVNRGLWETIRNGFERAAEICQPGDIIVRMDCDDTHSCGYRAYRAELVQDALNIFENTFIDLRGLGFTCTLEKLIKFRMMKAKIGEIPFELKYNLKRSPSKMISSITTLGYLVLILKYIYPWGDTAKGWLRQINELNKGKNHWRGN